MEQRNDPGAGVGRHPAQTYDALVGAALLLVGALGFIVSAAFSTGEPRGKDLIIFEVNGWHNVVHIASGVLLLLGVASWRRARSVTLLFGMAYGLVTIVGWIDGDDVFGLFPTDLADNLLHTVLTLAAFLTALAPAPAGTLRWRLSPTTPGRGPAGRRAGRPS